MKIYIITKGEYSDYHICTATTDLGTAKRLEKIYSDDWDKANIETFEDSEVNNGLTLYECRFYIDNKQYTILPCDLSGNRINFLYRNLNVLHKNYELYIYAKDEKHAKKIFDDKIAEYKAKKNGII